MFARGSPIRSLLMLVAVLVLTLFSVPVTEPPNDAGGFAVELIGASPGDLPEVTVLDAIALERIAIGAVALRTSLELVALTEPTAAVASVRVVRSTASPILEHDARPPNRQRT